MLRCFGRWACWSRPAQACRKDQQGEAGKNSGNKRSPLERGNCEVIVISGNIWGVFFLHLQSHHHRTHTPAGEHRQRLWRIYPSQVGTAKAQKQCIAAGLCYKLRRTMVRLYGGCPEDISIQDGVRQAGSSKPFSSCPPVWKRQTIFYPGLSGKRRYGRALFRLISENDRGSL